MFLQSPHSGAPPGALVPGTQMGRWLVLESVGAGGYGAVYRVEAEDQPGVPYALKVALRLGDGRAEREVALLRSHAVHPNVVRIHDWGLGPGGCVYFVMDWVQGLPLHTWAERHNPSFRELVR